MITERICIYPKDVMLITGRSERSGCKLLQTIRKKYYKTKHQFVSIFKFSEYTGLQIEEIWSLNVTLVNPADTEEMALTLNARKSKLGLVDFIQLGERLNIPVPALRNSLKKFSSRNVAVNELIEKSFLDKDAKQAFMEIWEKKQQIFK